MFEVLKVAAAGAALAATLATFAHVMAPVPAQPSPGFWLNTAPSPRNAPIAGERCSTLDAFSDDGCSHEQAAAPISGSGIANAKQVETSAGNNV